MCSISFGLALVRTHNNEHIDLDHSRVSGFEDYGIISPVAVPGITFKTEDRAGKRRLCPGRI